MGELEKVKVQVIVVVEVQVEHRDDGAKRAQLLVGKRRHSLCYWWYTPRMVLAEENRKFTGEKMGEGVAVLGLLVEEGE